MATIHKEIAIERSKEIVWDAIRDVGAIHKRLVPGFVVDCELEGEWRTVSLQMAWSYGNSSSLSMKKTAAHAWSARGAPLTHHNASVQVFPDSDEKCRVVWIADLMPDEVAEAIAEMIEQGLSRMKQTLEASPTTG